MDVCGNEPERLRTEQVSASDIAERASETRPDAVLLNDLPAANGCDALQLIRSLRDQDRHLPIFYRTSDDPGSLSRGLAALELGANELISQSVSTQELQRRIADAVLARRLQKRPTVSGAARFSEDGESRKREFVAADPPLVDAVSFAVQAVRMRLPLLLHGEAGTGKTSLAGVLCDAAGGIIQGRTVDCAIASAEAISEFLFAPAGSQLDASERCRDAALPAADRLSNGSDCLLVIENIDLAPRAIQLRLSAALRQAFCGTASAIPRLIMTASVSLVHSGGEATGLAEPLRHDLAGAMIELPPLRERAGDMDRLIDCFLCRATNTRPLDVTGLDPRVSDEARSTLREYLWPGNLGELDGVIRGELCRGGGVISMSPRLRQMAADSTPRKKMPVSQCCETTGCSDSATDGQATVVNHASESNSPASLHPAALASPAAWSDYVESISLDSQSGEESSSHFADAVQAAESGLLAAVLEKTGGNIAQSARLLGITRVSLRRKINALGIRKGIE